MGRGFLGKLFWTAFLGFFLAGVGFAEDRLTCGTDISDDPNSQLSATLLGKFEPGGHPKLAIRWNGEPGAFLDIWVDLDGDGADVPGEILVLGRPLESGVEVVEIEIPDGVEAVSEPALAFRVWHGGGTAETRWEMKAGVTPSEGGCRWQPGYFLDDFDGAVLTFAVFDDGTGEALYAGGRFQVADGVEVNGIAKWDGASWSALRGSTGVGVEGGSDSSVRALAVFDDGRGEALFVGGYFGRAGGVVTGTIARWDGSEWTNLQGSPGVVLSNWVEALVVYDDGSGEALYVGGHFDDAGGVEVDHIAKWDGTQWSALKGELGTGTNYPVFSLGVFDDGPGASLFVGGGFSHAGGILVNHIAKWDGDEWSPLGGPNGVGVSYGVNAMVVFDNGGGRGLYVGGQFDTAGGIEANSIAKWDGLTWAALTDVGGTGIDGEVDALEVFDDGTGPVLFVGGSFYSAGGHRVENLAMWDGFLWSPVQGSQGFGTDSEVIALAVFSDDVVPKLFVGGYFETAGGKTVRHIAKWDGVEWWPLEVSGFGLNGAILSLAIFDDGSGSALFAGGFFTLAGGITVNGIAKWDGETWSPLTGPLGPGVERASVYSLAVFDDGNVPALYAGGLMSDAGGVVVTGIAKWDGASWSVLEGPSGTGTDGQVLALEVFNDGTGDALYAGGDFMTAGGITVNRIAKWDGTRWWPLVGSSGNGLNAYPYAMKVFDDGSGDALYVGGVFSRAGGVVAIRVAKWDGVEWYGVSNSADPAINGFVYSLEVFDDGSGSALFVGGDFTQIDGIPASYIGRWDGTEWTALSPQSVFPGVSNYVYGMTVFDDGSGESLYVGGKFTRAGDFVDANRIVRWNGLEWTDLSGPLSNGVDGNHASVSTLQPFDDGSGNALFVGGSFESAGGIPSGNFGKWQCVDLVYSDGFEGGDVRRWDIVQP